MISIIDYGMGNVRSVFNAFEILGADVEIIDDPKKLTNSEAIILPGVGAFRDGMKNLEKMGFINKLKEEVIDNKKPYLGICLGLEFLADKSFEGGETDGFGWIKGEIKKIETGNDELKIPHMGWDDTIIKKNTRLLRDMKNPVFYYLHSFFLEVKKTEIEYIESICEYGKTKIISSIHKENIYAVQFHPEKSQESGLKLINNFLELIKEK